MAAIADFRGAAAGHPTRIEEQAVRERRMIKSGEVVIDAERTQGDVTERYRRHLWLSPRGIREDTTRPAGHRGNYAAGNAITAVKWRTSAGQADWTHDSPLPERAKAVRYIDIAKGGHPDELQSPLDLRIIGFCPLDTFNSLQFNLESFVASPNRQSTTTLQIEESGVSMTEVAYQRTGGVTVRIRFRNDLAGALVRISLDEEYLGQPLSDTTDCMDFLAHPSGVSYPQRFLYKRVHGGRVERTEEGRISIQSLNDPIPDSVFSIPGMHLPRGTHVSMIPGEPGGEYYWNGEKLVFSTTGRPAPTAVRPKGNVFLYLTAAALAIAAAIAAAMSVWRRGR